MLFQTFQITFSSASTVQDDCEPEESSESEDVDLTGVLVVQNPAIPVDRFITSIRKDTFF